MRFNLFLYKSNVLSFGDCLVPRSPAKRYEPIHFGEQDDYRVYLVRGEEKPPRWMSFIRDHVEPSAIESVHNQFNSAVILVRVDTTDGPRFFAISCGFGYHIIDREKIEPNFGLITTLNSVHPKKIRSVDSKSIGVQTFQKREASNLATGLTEFGFDFDSEIIRIVSGVCSDEKLGTRIGGADNLFITAKVGFDGIYSKCASLYEMFRRTDYRSAGFGFIDSVRFETDPSAVKVLDRILLDALNRKQNDLKISVAYPDQIDYERCSHYSVRGFRKCEDMDDVELPGIYEFIGTNSVDLDDLKKRVRIVGFESSSSNVPCTASEPLYAYLTFETTRNGKIYVLTNSKWYCIDSSYLKDLDTALRAQVGHYDTAPLKAWPKAREEGYYNSLYASDPDYLHLDKNLFHLGHQKIEVADFFHRPTKKLYCVKKLNRSSTLSHLFGQASVSADLFKGLPEYRSKFLEAVTDRWPGETFGADYINDLTFVYAIGTEKAGDLLDALPLFSKVNLLKHLRIILKMGYGVKLARVSLV